MRTISLLFLMFILTVTANAERTDIECARIKNGQIIQIYEGVFNTETQRITINGKDYSHKYIMGTEQTIRDVLRIGYKMHICINKEG